MRFREFKQTLNEDKITFIADQLGDKLLTAYEKDHGNKPELATPEDVVKTLAQTNHKAVQWLANRYVAGDYKLEDLPAIKTDLELFAKVSSRLPPEQKDLNRLKLRDLRAAIKPFEGKAVESNKEKARQFRDKLYSSGAIKIFHKDKDMIVAVPTTEEASCYLGRNTKWCTAYTTAKNQFDHYNSEGPLYNIIFTGGKFKGRKFQFHFESGEFNDEENEPINDQEDDYNDQRDEQDLRRWAEPDDPDYDEEHDEGMTWSGDPEPEGHYIYRVNHNEWTTQEEYGMQPKYVMDDLVAEYPQLRKIFSAQAREHDTGADALDSPRVDEPTPTSNSWPGDADDITIAKDVDSDPMLLRGLTIHQQTPEIVASAMEGDGMQKHTFSNKLGIVYMIHDPGIREIWEIRVRKEKKDRDNI